MKPRSLLALTLLVGFTLCAARGQETMPKNQVVKSFRQKKTTTVAVNYLLFLPDGYNARGAKRWPLILFLHGAGERGTNLSAVTKHGPPRLVKDRPDFPFVVVSPQCPSGQTWSDETLLALLDEILKKHKIDPGRVYLTGLSMGGYGTWSLGLKHPERFAAMAPICGGGSILPALLPSAANARRLKRLPVWAFHGAKDELVALDESERLVEALRRIGNAAKLTVYPEAGHDSWTETYNNPKFYEWLFAQQRTQ